MNEVVLDTNIILDYLSIRRPAHADAVELLDELIGSEDEAPVMLASSVKDAYYILCRHYKDERRARSLLDDFRKIVTVIALDNQVLDLAFASDEPDLEDGIVRAAAELLDATAIVTRDARAYQWSFVPSMDARAFLDRKKERGSSQQGK